jgi:hypothetical protein
MNLADRAVKMLTTPKTEWEVVAAESESMPQIGMGYVVPMTLAAHLAAFLGSAFVGALFGAMLGIRHSMGYFLLMAVVGWVLSVLAVYAQAWVVNALAPSFGSTPNLLSAFKLVVFSATAAWVGSLLMIIPAVGPLAAFAGLVYSIYLFYLGMPRLMGTPPDKVVPYMLVSALVILVLTIGASTIATVVVGVMFGAGALTFHG